MLKQFFQTERFLYISIVAIFIFGAISIWLFNVLRTDNKQWDIVFLKNQQILVGQLKLLQAGFVQLTDVYKIEPVLAPSTLSKSKQFQLLGRPQELFELRKLHIDNKSEFTFAPSQIDSWQVLANNSPVVAQVMRLELNQDQ